MHFATSLPVDNSKGGSGKLYFLGYGKMYFGHRLLSLLSMTFKQIYTSLGLDLGNDNLDLKITSPAAAGVEIATSTVTKVTKYCGFPTKRVALAAKSQQVHFLNGRPDFFLLTH